eukprot:m.39084 g.39084  ORF g.39084 m.39084 type:complete len:381 (-) comp12637_c0_seq1:63-1205(-)
MLAASRRAVASTLRPARYASTNAKAGSSTLADWGHLAFMAGAGAAVAYALSSQSTSVAQTGSALESRVANMEIELSNNRNRAFVFIKPHAVNDKVIDVVKAKLGEAGISITGEGSLDAKTIDEGMLIDNHYGAIASKAMKIEPKDLNVPAKGQEKFAKMFGESWEDALAKGKVYNAAGACTKLAINGNQLDKKWSTLKRDVNLLKFGGGFYVAKLSDDVYAINGFYMSMRSAYVKFGASIHWFTVEWSPDTLSWEDFRAKTLGATDPSTAAKGSVRRHIYDNYKSLDLAEKPNVGDNGVHASASPFEAMAERVNWVGASLETDGFGKAMLAAGIPRATVDAWSQDPQVAFDGGKASLFDLLEDMNSRDCLEKSIAINAEQ